jgi:hypothetical protein
MHVFQNIIQFTIQFIFSYYNLQVYLVQKLD